MAGRESLLSIRSFERCEKLAAYERQGQNARYAEKSLILKKCMVTILSLGAREEKQSLKTVKCFAGVVI